MKTFIETEVEEGSYASRSDYVRQLVRRDMDRQQLRSLLLLGAASPTTELADSAYFDAMRARILEAARQTRPPTVP